MEEKVIIKGVFSGLSRAELTVTDKRVYGKTGLGKVVDLPIGSIYKVVAVNGNATLNILSASKIYQFSILKNGEAVYNALNEQIKNAPKDENDHSILKCSTAINTITVYDDYFVIGQRSSVLNTLISKSIFEEEKKLYYTNISSLEFGEPTSFAAGKIKFEFAGGYNSANNIIYFPEADRDDMKKIYDFIDKKVQEVRAGNNTSVGGFSVADELSKFKNLLDSGIISQEEFDEKKKQLLGL